MSNEARINSGLQIRVGYTDYQSRPGAFLADVAEASAPTPGQVEVAVTPTVVDLSVRDTPGYGTIQNLDATNYVEVGAYNSDDGEFLPLFEILPGQSYTFLFSRILGQEVVGTGTTGSTASLALRANTAAVICDVRVFER